MEFKYNDGGRSAAGFKGSTGDCVVRAIAIATQTDYKTVYTSINELAANEKLTKKRTKKSNARTGVNKKIYEDYLKTIGWTWVPTMLVGQGCKVHLNAEELPKGRIIARLSRHMVAVVDGVLHDTYDSSRGESRCVYGYFHRIGD